MRHWSKKGVQMAFCGCKTVNLNISTIKILGVHLSYNEQLAKNMNFVETVNQVEKILRIWSQRSLILSGRIVSFKALALSKIVYFASLVVVPEKIHNKLGSIHKNFIWKRKKPKIKHSSIIADYTDGRQKDVDISAKIKALQLVWVRRLFEENFHLWKLIPLNSLSSIGTKSLFHSNQHLAVDLPSCLPNFYKTIIQHWIQFARYVPSNASEVMSECLWLNRFIKLSNKSFIMKTFSSKGVEHVSDILSEKGIIPWEIFKNKYSLTDREHFKFQFQFFQFQFQLIDAVPKEWKDVIMSDSYENDPSTILDCSNIIFINQKPVSVKTLTSKVIYPELISRIY